MKYKLHSVYLLAWLLIIQRFAQIFVEMITKKKNSVLIELRNSSYLSHRFVCFHAANDL